MSDDHSLPKTLTGEPRAFFGRRSGKKLHEGQKAIVDAVMPAVELVLDGPLDPGVLFPAAQRHVIEIGYGGGEHLARKAEEQPETGFIGKPGRDKVAEVCAQCHAGSGDEESD